MRRFIILCLLPLLFSCCSSDDSPSWTVLVYMAGDNNLSNAALLDLSEMEAVGSDPNLQIIVQLDTSNEGTKRLTVQPGGAIVVEDLGERNMADPHTLTDFLVWAKNRYRSQRRALILWDHGNGYQKPASGPIRYGILQDDHEGVPCCLSNVIVRQAIETARVHFDLLGFDASQMAQIETAYEFRNTADLLVFSQETGQANGWDYTAILTGLRNHPEMQSAALANLIVETYQNFYEQVFYPANPNFEQYLTISAVRLGADIEQLASLVDTLARNLTAAIQDQTTRDAAILAVGSAANSTQQMDMLTSPYTYLDLFDLAEKLSEQSALNQSVQDALASLKSMKDAVVISEYHGSARPLATGLSIVFFTLPKAVDFNVYDSAYIAGTRNLDFIKDTAWNEFLSAYYKAAELL
ncbi:MAG: hypothetical protein HY037_00215 [Nitrospirae bacterium]|nr:hypothetical protein [Candidatus Troglogloeales bacterium]